MNDKQRSTGNRLARHGGVGRTSRHFYGLVAVCCCLSFPTVAAAQADARLRTGEAQQQQLLERTRLVAARLDAILAELQRNGLGESDEARALGQIRGMLGQLSESQMAEVIDLLRQARTQNERGSLRDAHLRQQEIVLKFRRLIDAYQQQEDVRELARGFAELAGQQRRAFSNAADLARSIGLDAARMRDAERAALEVQTGRQRLIRDEAERLLAGVDRLHQASTGEIRQRLTAARRLAAANDIAGMLQGIGRDLDGANLYQAATAQQRAAGLFQELAETLDEPKERLEKLQQAREELDRLVARQKRLAETQADPDDMAEEQQQLADQAQRQQGRLQELVPDAARAADEAAKRMADAQQQLDKQNAAEANKKQEQATAKLEEARAAVEKAIAQEEALAEARMQERMAAEAQAADQARADQAGADPAQNAEAAQKQDSPPADNLEKTRQLLEDVEQMRGEQAELAQQPVENDTARERQRAQQQALKEKAQRAAEQAQQAAPEAAERLQEAQRRMEAADEAMARKQEANAQAQQEEAAAELAEASKALQDRLGELEQAQAEMQQLEARREQVAELMQKQQEVAQQTQQAAAEQQADAQQLSQPEQMQQLAEQQQQVAQETNQAREQAAEQTPNTAEEALAQAQAKMQAAGEQLAQQAPAAAGQPQAEAQQALSDAKRAIDERAAELAEQLGKPAPAPTEPSQLAQAVEQVQQQAAEAGKQLDQQQAPAAGQQLAQAAMNLTQAMAQAPAAEMNTAMDQALQQARTSLTQAAAQASSGQPSEAQNTLQQAMQQLAQAQAVDAMMPGVSLPGLVRGDQPAQQGPQGQIMPEGEGNEIGPRDGGEVATDGQMPTGDGGYIGLPERERAALQQAQGAKYPPAYGEQIRQYLKNVAETSQEDR